MPLLEARISSCYSQLASSCGRVNRFEATSNTSKSLPWSCSAKRGMRRLKPSHTPRAGSNSRWLSGVAQPVLNDAFVPRIGVGFHILLIFCTHKVLGCFSFRLTLGTSRGCLGNPISTKSISTLLVSRCFQQLWGFHSSHALLFQQLCFQRSSGRVDIWLQKLQFAFQKKVQ